jgi:glycogen synthase
MKILIYSPGFYPSVGGSEITSKYLAAALQAAGQDILLLTETPLGHHTEQEPSLPILRQPTIAEILSAVRWADLIIVKPEQSAKLALIASLCRTRFVVYNETSSPLPRNTMRGPRTVLGVLHRLLSRTATLHLGVSKASLDAKRLPASVKSRVVYNYLDPALVIPADLDPDLSRTVDILFVGRLVAEKGVGVLMRALEILDTRRVVLKVVLAGPSPPPGDLARRAKALKAVSVSFVQDPSRLDLARLYGSARVAAIPSIAPEGFQLVAVATYATPADATSLAECLWLLSSDRELRSSQSGAGRAVAMKYTYEAFTSEFLQVLRDLAPGRV